MTTLDTLGVKQNPYYTVPMREAFAEGWRQHQIGMHADLNTPAVTDRLTVTAFWRGWAACREAMSNEV
jgi:hypothetical protein